MSTNTENFEDLVKKEYEHGFVTDIDADTIPPGLSEEIITFISKKKDEPMWLLEWRLKAYRQWLKQAPLRLPQKLKYIVLWRY